MKNRLENNPIFISLYVFTLISYLFATLAFIVSKWYGMYPGSMSTFQNIGLWEICFSSFMNEDIYDQLFSDCFYISGPELSDLYSWIVTNWFLACQVTYTFSYIGLMISILICTLMCLGLWNIKLKRYVIILIALHLFSSVMCFITLLLFGVNTKDMTDYQWMPNPSQCSLSWSYGSASLSLLASMVCLGLLFYVLHHQHNNYILWSCDEESKYEETSNNKLVVDVTPSNIGASIYDPRGTSSASKISGERDQSVMSSNLGPSHRNVSRNPRQPSVSNISNSKQTHFEKSPKVNKPIPQNSSVITENPSSGIHSRKSNKPDSYTKPEKSNANTDSKKSVKISSPPTSQLTVTSRNASSTIITARPMKRN